MIKVNTMRLIEDTKRLYTVRGVLGLNSRQRSILCPLPGHVHKSGTPSFSVFYGRDGFERWRCHGFCAKFGDVVDLAGYIHVVGYDPLNEEHILRAIDWLGGNEKFETVKAVRIRQGIPHNSFREFLPIGMAAREYARSRGLDDHTINKFHLGEHRRGDSVYLAIPSFENHDLKGIKFRLAKGDGMRFYSLKGSLASMFNYDGVYMTTDPVLIVKAEIPVMLLDQLGFLACSHTGGEEVLMDEYTYVLSFCSSRVVVGDNDHMAVKARERAQVLRAELHFPPAQYKDIDEWILADKSAIKEIERWLCCK